MIVSDNFQLICIIATQKVAHYTVNFDLIHKSFALLFFNSCIVSGKIFQAIASVVVLVGVTTRGTTLRTVKMILTLLIQCEI